MRFQKGHSEAVSCSSPCLPLSAARGKPGPGRPGTRRRGGRLGQGCGGQPGAVQRRVLPDRPPRDPGSRPSLLGGDRDAGGWAQGRAGWALRPRCLPLMGWGIAGRSSTDGVSLGASRGRGGRFAGLRAGQGVSYEAHTSQRVWNMIRGVEERNNSPSI